ncbi:MAG TPA: hypothetical protein VIL48_05845 [Acidimicrobiales bacterium]
MVVTRLRLVLIAVAIGALLALGAASVAVGPTGGAPATPGDEDVVAVSTTAVRSSVAEHITRVAEHVTRVAERMAEHMARAVSVPASPVGLGLACLAALWSAASGLVGRRRRRIGDVGDDWRSLLVGAPPARA